jgi:hypothetical protein
MTDMQISHIVETAEGMQIDETSVRFINGFKANARFKAPYLVRKPPKSLYKCVLEERLDRDIFNYAINQLTAP